MPARPAPEGIRITKVGVWFIVLTLIVALGATNTGNNALYLVWSVLLAALVVSGVVSRTNVLGLAIEVEPPREVFAHRPFALRFSISNRGRWWSRWFLLCDVAHLGTPSLIPFLPRRGSGKGEIELSLPRRGRQRLRYVHVSSLFPFGFFRKGTRYPLELELLVYPELFASGGELPKQTVELGEETARRSGVGTDLHALRRFQAGDDPRGIHWKRTAATGELIFREREAEHTQRLSIVLDNGRAVSSGRAVPPTSEEEQRFERLVSEAATVAVDALGRGYSVELVARGTRVPFAQGRRQRNAILEALALIEPVAREATPLASSDPRVPQIRLRLAAEAEVSAC